jgi:hypothetical protein
VTRFLLHRSNHPHKTADVSGRHAARDGALEIRQVIVNLPGDPFPFRGRRDDERAAIGGADLPRDEAAVREPIEDARQGRSRVREAMMQILDGRGRRRGELREDVRLALRQPELAEVSEVEADPMRRAVDAWNQA